MYQNKCCAKILLSLLFILVFAFPGYSFCEEGADSTTTRYALKDGKCMAYYCKAANEPFWLGSGGNNCSEMCSSGNIQNKYTAVGCSYTTQTRTCCSDGSWSEWDKACPAAPSCGSNQCWNGSVCEDLDVVIKNCSTIANTSGGGSLTRTSSCTNGGWNYGSWSGTCTCKTGYKWIPFTLSCVAPPDPDYINCVELGGGTAVTVSGLAYGSDFQGTPYNSDYYYDVEASIRFTGVCQGSATVSGRISISSSGGYFSSNLPVSKPSNCGATVGTAQLGLRCDRVVVRSKGWK